MLQPDRILQLTADPDGSIHFLSDCITLGEGQRESWETVTRVVRFEDDWYGEVEITRAKLNQMVRNFDGGVYGQAVFIDVSHRPDEGSAGEIKELKVEQNKLRARIAWSDYGLDKDPETGKKHGALLRGAGLTTRPRVKRLDPVDPARLQLSFDDERHYVVSPRISHILHDEVIETMKEHLKKLRAQLEGKKLSEKTFTAILAAAKALSEEDIKRILAAEREAEEKRQANVRLFTDDLKKKLCERVEYLITADLSEKQIKALSDNAIALGNQMTAQARLSSLDFEGASGGSMHISVDDSNAIRSLPETVSWDEDGPAGRPPGSKVNTGATVCTLPAWRSTSEKAACPGFSCRKFETIWRQG